VLKRGKVKVFGSPFDIKYSSCSNLKPTLFDWDAYESDIHVYIDYAIVNQGHLSPKTISRLKVGWLCESNEIYLDLYNYVKNNTQEVFSKFDYIFTSDKSLLSLDRRFRFCFSCSNIPWTPKDSWGIYPKTKICSMICSEKKMCYGHLYRHQVAQIYMGDVDIYGGAFGSPFTGEKYDGFYKKENALKDYMFSIVIQNNFKPHFFTEHLTDCFAYGTIPIYLGDPEINRFFNGNGILKYQGGFDIKTLSIDMYNSKIDAINENLEIIKKMPMSDDYLYLQCLEILGAKKNG
jgi:hypothetical protein